MATIVADYRFFLFIEPKRIMIINNNDFILKFVGYRPGFGGIGGGYPGYGGNYGGYGGYGKIFTNFFQTNSH